MQPLIATIETSLFDMFEAGPGPSSSHTIGPMKAGHDFRSLCAALPPEVARGIDANGGSGAAALERVRTFAAGRAQHVEHDDGQKRTHLCARLRGSLRLIAIEDIRYLQADEKYVVVHHARGEDLIEESLKSLEEEFGGRFVPEALFAALDELEAAFTAAQKAGMAAGSTCSAASATLTRSKRRR